jgi:hypothetical protein
VAPTRVINPGDLICGQCGEGNDPARKFCRRCGASLVKAEVFTAPWYRQLWLRLTTRKTRQAGERPKVRRRMIGGAGPGWLTSWVTKLILIAVVALVVLTFIGPWHHSLRHTANRWYHDVVGAVHPTYNAVSLVSATATSSAPGHPADLAIDGKSNTSWQSAGVGSGVGQALAIKIDGPINVDKVGFLNGDDDVPGAFLSQPRPETVKLAFAGQHPFTKTITLKNTASFQTHSVSAKGSVALTITIMSVYPSSQGGKNVAITEVELFSKKS